MAYSTEERVTSLLASSVGKFQVTVFWDCEGVIRIDYCPPELTINAEYYSSLVQIVHKLLPEKRPGKVSRRPLFLQDNARVHTAKTTVTTTKKLKWQLLPQLPYSPDLAPSDFHVFGRLKEPLRGIRFKDEKEIKKAVKASIARFPQEWFEEGIKKLEKRWKRCIEIEGDYIEK